MFGRAAQRGRGSPSSKRAFTVSCGYQEVWQSVRRRRGSRSGCPRRLWNVAASLCSRAFTPGGSNVGLSDLREPRNIYTGTKRTVQRVTTRFARYLSGALRADLRPRARQRLDIAPDRPLPIDRLDGCGDRRAPPQHGDEGWNERAADRDDPERCTHCPHHSHHLAERGSLIRRPPIAAGSAQPGGRLPARSAIIGTRSWNVRVRNSASHGARQARTPESAPVRARLTAQYVAHFPPLAVIDRQVSVTTARSSATDSAMTTRKLASSSAVAHRWSATRSTVMPASAARVAWGSPTPRARKASATAVA